MSDSSWICKNCFEEFTHHECLKSITWTTFTISWNFSSSWEGVMINWMRRRSRRKGFPFRRRAARRAPSRPGHCIISEGNSRCIFHPLLYAREPRFVAQPSRVDERPYFHNARLSLSPLSSRWSVNSFYATAVRTRQRKRRGHAAALSC